MKKPKGSGTYDQKISIWRPVSTVNEENGSKEFVPELVIERAWGSVKFIGTPSAGASEDKINDQRTGKIKIEVFMRYVKGVQFDDFIVYRGGHYEIYSIQLTDANSVLVLRAELRDDYTWSIGNTEQVSNDLLAANYYLPGTGMNEGVQYSENTLIPYQGKPTVIERTGSFGDTMASEVLTADAASNAFYIDPEFYYDDVRSGTSIKNISSEILNNFTVAGELKDFIDWGVADGTYTITVRDEYSRHLYPYIDEKYRYYNQPSGDFSITPQIPLNHVYSSVFAAEVEHNGSTVYPVGFSVRLDRPQGNSYVNIPQHFYSDISARFEAIVFNKETLNVFKVSTPVTIRDKSPSKVMVASFYQATESITAGSTRYASRNYAAYATDTDEMFVDCALRYGRISGSIPYNRDGSTTNALIRSMNMYHIEIDGNDDTDFNVDFSAASKELNWGHDSEMASYGVPGLTQDPDIYRYASNMKTEDFTWTPVYVRRGASEDLTGYITDINASYGTFKLTSLPTPLKTIFAQSLYITYSVDLIRDYDYDQTIVYSTPYYELPIVTFTMEEYDAYLVQQAYLAENDNVLPEGEELIELDLEAFPTNEEAYIRQSIAITDNVGIDVVVCKCGDLFPREMMIRAAFIDPYANSVWPI